MPTIWQRMAKNAGYAHIEQQLKDIVRQNSGIVTVEHLIWYCDKMKEMKMDNNILVCGQNGSGKSVTVFNIAARSIVKAFKTVRPIFRDTNIYRLASYICTDETSVIAIDELKKYLHYMGWNTRGQKKLIESIEVARENRNLIIGATKEPHKINSEYRDGKVHTVIFLLDRNKDDAPFGFVLHCYAYLEQDDKFNFDEFKYARSLRSILEMAEANSMFLGWFFAPSGFQFDMKDYEGKKKQAVEQLAKELDARGKKEEAYAIDAFVMETQPEKAAGAILKWSREKQQQGLVQWRTKDVNEAFQSQFNKRVIAAGLSKLFKEGYVSKLKNGIYVKNVEKDKASV